MEMSNQRQPLLSDEAMDFISCPQYEDRPTDSQMIADLLIGITRVRDFYESLITTGKLRVVEEVKSYHEILFGCPSCKSVWDKQPRWSQNGKIRTMHYCPGCGNKIKR